MASIVWDSQRVIMIDYLEQGRILCRRLRWLRQKIARKRREQLTRNVLLLQDNAPAHTSQVAMTAATECGFEIRPHPDYSPDTCMSPSKFYLFLKLKSLRGTQYEGIEGIKKALKEYLGDQEKAFYLERIRKLEQRWAKCIALREDYIEK